MKKLLFNISNHPSQEWEEKQREGWDQIIDIPFPSISPNMSMGEVWDLGVNIRASIHDLVRKEEFGYLLWYPIYVMVEGEFSLTFAITELLRQSGWFVILAFPTSERIVEPDGRRQFKFTGWRFVSLRNAEIANSGFIELKNGQGFEVYARCHYAYIGRINGEIKVIFEDDPDFPENPNQNEYDEEGNLISAWYPYYDGVPELFIINDTIIDEITHRTLVTITPIQNGWRIYDHKNNEATYFSNYVQAQKFAYERALLAFFKTNLEVK